MSSHQERLNKTNKVYDIIIDSDPRTKFRYRIEDNYGNTHRCGIGIICILKANPFLRLRFNVIFLIKDIETGDVFEVNSDQFEIEIETIEEEGA